MYSLFRILNPLLNQIALLHLQILNQGVNLIIRIFKALKDSAFLGI
jgi:hypothetical protein